MFSKSLSITERPWWCHQHPTCAAFLLWLNKQPSSRAFWVWPAFGFNVVLIRGSWLLVLSGNSVKYFTFLIENNCLCRLRSQVLNCGVSGVLLFFNVSMREKKEVEKERMRVFVIENTHQTRNILPFMHKVKNIWVNLLHVLQTR